MSSSLTIWQKFIFAKKMENPVFPQKQNISLPYTKFFQFRKIPLKFRDFFYDFFLCHFPNNYMNTHEKWENSKLCENTPLPRRLVSTQLDKLRGSNRGHGFDYISGWEGTTPPGPS